VLRGSLCKYRLQEQGRWEYSWIDARPNRAGGSEMFLVTGTVFGLVPRNQMPALGIANVSTTIYV